VNETIYRICCLDAPEFARRLCHFDTAQVSNLQIIRNGPLAAIPRRTAPFDLEPGFYEPAGLWLYGNTRLLEVKLECLPETFGPDIHSESQLNEIEREAERIVLSGTVLVCGIHNAAHQRTAIVPLRWGAPRIVVFSGGFEYHLGEKLDREPFRIARLWRYEWDARTDLAISLRSPEKKPTFAVHNPTVDRLIAKISARQISGLLFENACSQR
jgi:DNA processing protein